MATITSSTGSTESETERAARSVALEQAYVHEVYDQCADRTVQGKHWPRICEFVEELEPGALVCDVGCGNGKYLDVNRNVFKIGIDRCTKLTNIARDRDKEVLTCDNLALPFRDESFDAVLSIAVVHHFSTTERRVRALKELARVLRIGGRIIISVWAMEQKHRKFESQDVLVPWPRAYCISSTGAPIKPRDIFCGDERGHRGDKMHPHPLHPTYLLTKRGSQQRRGSKGNKSYWIDPIFSPSPSTSSLSSPNETCYSFFRRALQKLAGGSRTSRAWFLENWPNGSKDHRPRYDNDEEEENDDEDVDSLPIELRRLEEGVVINVIGCGDENSNSQDLKRPQLRQQSSDSLSVKSKSLGNMVEAQQRQDIVRSRSSTPRLCSNENSVDKKETTANLVKEQLQSTAAVPRVELAVTTDATTSISTTSTTQTSSKPRLVKQKTHFNDDSCLLDVPKNTAIQPLETDLPEQQESPLSSINSSFKRITSNVHKQSSMNEELMSIERLKERESVRKNIMKQASLNEELIYKSKPTFESFRDTLYSSGARFQLLKSGLTSRIKQSTTNIEKVSGMSLKNGFVRILQSWTSTESPSTNTTSTTTSSNNSEHSRSQCSTPFSMRSGDIERRLSREDGSDSSKDSSLQSDTSVDSEDSFASVIYVPKKNSSPMIETAGLPQAKNSSSNIFGPLSPVGCLQQLSTASAPPSPRVKYAPDFQSSHHRLKHISMSPLVKQFPATSKSLPPPSPPGLSPRTLNSANLKPFFSGNDTIPVANSSSNTAPTTSTGTTSGDVVSDNASFLEKIAEVKRSFDIQPLPKIPSREERSFNTSTLEQTNPFFSMITNDQQAQTSTESVKAISPPKQDLDFTKDLGELQSKATTSTADTSLEKTVDTKEKVSSGNPFLSMTETIAPPALDSLQPVAKTSTSVGASKGAIKKGTKASSGASSSGLPEEEEKIRSSKLNEIKELLSAKPDFAVRTRPAYPLVRRASTSATSSKVSKVLPKMMSLELFNPETDDLDSDSSDAASGTSTPESVGSVISVISDERYKKTDPFDLTNSSSNSSSNNNSNDSGDSEDKPTTTTATTTTTTTTATEPSSTKPAALDKHLSPVESTWSEECKRHLLDLTDRLSSTESLINGTDQYSRKTKLELHSSSTESVSSTRKTSICKYNSGLNKRPAAADSIYVPDNNNKLLENGVICESVDENDVDEGTGSTTKLIQRSCSDDSDNGSVSSSFVVISNSGDVPQKHQQQQLQQQSTKAPKIGQQRYINNSIESSDIGDSIENTISTESSQTSDSRKLYCSGSTASLSSSESSRARLQARSSSEETPSRRLGRHRLHQHQSTRSNGTLSGSSSQESLPSDQINYHQFYHVFREGELDQLIEKYVENLHIISSYYDHASWCVVAEKVQVWTI